MACTPPYSRGTGCCKCCPPPGCDSITVNFTSSNCSSSSSASACSDGCGPDAPTNCCQYAKLTISNPGIPRCNLVEFDYFPGGSFFLNCGPYGPNGEYGHLLFVDLCAGSNCAGNNQDCSTEEFFIPTVIKNGFCCSPVGIYQLPILNPDCSNVTVTIEIANGTVDPNYSGILPCELVTVRYCDCPDAPDGAAFTYQVQIPQSCPGCPFPSGLDINLSEPCTWRGTSIFVGVTAVMSISGSNVLLEFVCNSSLPGPFCSSPWTISGTIPVSSFDWLGPNTFTMTSSTGTPGTCFCTGMQITLTTSSSYPLTEPCP